MTDRLSNERKRGACRLCALQHKPGKILEIFFITDRGRTIPYIVVPTLDDKGHEFRVMILSALHVSSLRPEDEAWLRGVFACFILKSLSEKHQAFTIMESTHASIRNHWHLVASTLDHGSDDEQLLRTQRIEYRWSGTDWEVRECPGGALA